VTGVLAAAVVAGACAGVLCRPGPRALARRRLGAGSGGRGVGLDLAGRRLWASSASRWFLVPAGACGCLLVVLGWSAVLLVTAGTVATAGVSWLHAAGRRRRSAAHGRRQTTEACDALVAELRAGQPAVLALRRAAEHHPVLRPAARACGLGSEVPPALRQVAASPGAGGISTVAAAWQVAERSGSGLAPVLARVAEGLRADDATRADVAAALAPARATARLLAVLPAFGLLLGSGLGGDPVRLLFASPAGNALLLVGVTMALAGMVWVERLAHAVESCT
jgi:tight adherence protein B